MSDVYRFLRGEGCDRSGRQLDEVLAFGDATLEATHDYIQWLFPLDEPSQAVGGSPVLTQDDVKLIRNDQAAVANLDAAAARMTTFYRCTGHWLARHDHNHLRITRIIKSLRLLLGDEHANSFRDAILSRVASSDAAVNRETLRYWHQA
jgi:hypothetical protein